MTLDYLYKVLQLSSSRVNRDSVCQRNNYERFTVMVVFAVCLFDLWCRETPKLVLARREDEIDKITYLGLIEPSWSLKFSANILFRRLEGFPQELSQEQRDRKG